MNISNEDITPLKLQIGHIIQMERERIGLSVIEVSELSECSPQQVRALEDGSRDYTLVTFLKVMASLGMNLVLLNSNLEGYDAVGLQDV